MFDFLDQLGLGASAPSFGDEVAERLGADRDNFLLQRVRNRPEVARNQAFQDYIGPPEHRAFVREMTQGDPLMGAAMIPAIPAYTYAKGAKQAMGLPTGRSEAGLAEVLAAFRGLFDTGLGWK
jgi:hypothetical protein